MKQRVLTAIGIGIVGIPVILFSRYIVYPLFLGLLSAIGVWELLRVFGIEKRIEISVPSYLIAGLLPVFAHSFFTGGEDVERQDAAQQQGDSQKGQQPLCTLFHGFLSPKNKNEVMKLP